MPVGYSIIHVSQTEKTRLRTVAKGLPGIRQQEILKSDKSKINSLDGIHSSLSKMFCFAFYRTFQNFFRRIKDKSGKAGYPRFNGIGQYDSSHYLQVPEFQITPQGLNLSKIGTIKTKLHRPYTC